LPAEQARTQHLAAAARMSAWKRHCSPLEEHVLTGVDRVQGELLDPGSLAAIASKLAGARPPS